MKRVHPHLESTKPTSKGRFPPSIYVDRRLDRGGGTVMQPPVEGGAERGQPRFGRT
jgi:hypothetical protein